MQAPTVPTTPRPTVSPLLSTLRQSMVRDAPTLISIAGHGSISIYPDEGSYITDIRDWQSLAFDDGSGIRVSTGVWGSAPPGGMPVSELPWLVAYHHASKLPAGALRLPGLVKLRHWPDLSQVPQELAAPIVRICALLWRKPTSSTLMAQVVGAEPAQTDALLQVLESFRHIEVSNRPVDRALPEEPLPAPSGQAAMARASVISKLWQRLAGR